MGLSMHLSSKWYTESTASWRNCMEQFLPLYEWETDKTNVTFLLYKSFRKTYSTASCNFLHGAQLE